MHARKRGLILPINVSNFCFILPFLNIVPSKAGNVTGIDLFPTTFVRPLRTITEPSVWERNVVSLGFPASLALTSFSGRPG